MIVNLGEQIDITSLIYTLEVGGFIGFLFLIMLSMKFVNNKNK